MRPAYRIFYTKYERSGWLFCGWGPIADGHKDFNSYEEAKQHSDEFNLARHSSFDPKWCVEASNPQFVNLDRLDAEKDDIKNKNVPFIKYTAFHTYSPTTPK